MNCDDLLRRHDQYTLTHPESGFSLDVSGMDFGEDCLVALEGKFHSANEEMKRLEAGAIKNPDENRRVTHFTDRASYSGDTLFTEVEAFVEAVRSGTIKGSTGKKFDFVVSNGIGGSALGPEFIHFAVNGPYWNELSPEARRNYPKIYFLDNTDPAGVVDVLNAVDLSRTLFLTISKSGGTQESANNTAAFAQAFKKKGLDFAKHACAITMEDSRLDQTAKAEGWLKVFPMADSIGGRTSETSVVGHLPAALAGINFKALLDGACAMDVWTREPNFRRNPAYLLSAVWHIAGNGKGDRNMVIVPYSDRLVLLSKYLQQLVMESLGKELDLDGKVVHQGLNVFGNKGGTDAHAYIQQLNDGRDDFFITFVEVLRDAMDIPIADGVTMGDYLHGFNVGLAQALLQRGRQVVGIKIRKVDEANLGMLIALYERAVAVYAELIHINAFHQPGVQAYKLASKSVIGLVTRIQKELARMAPWTGGAEEFAAAAGLSDKRVIVGGILAKFAENAGIRRFSGFTIRRSYDNARGHWTYKVEKA